MLLDSAERYGEAEAKGDRVGRNIAVESFAVHCRALIVFLFGHLDKLEAQGEDDQGLGRREDNDVFAWDYYNGWEKVCPMPSEVMYHAKKRADKHVTHILTERRGINQEGTGLKSIWDMKSAVNEIVSVMALFVDKAAISINPEDLRKMKERLMPWRRGAVTPAPAMPTAAQSGGSQTAPFSGANLQATTDARTISTSSGYSSQGKTE
jgi:hypothetical protein